jgi:uncharacterized protein YneF (UPF0154 family)
MNAISIGIRAIGLTFRVVVAVLCILCGITAGFVMWWFASGILMGLLAAKYPPIGELGWPSDEMICVAVLAFPLTMVAGSWLGVEIGARLVGPKRARS